jgi:cyanophycin synthetase
VARARGRARGHRDPAAAGIPVSFGRTRETKVAGVYNLVYEMEEERVGIRAASWRSTSSSTARATWRARFHERASTPEALCGEKWALGPSTKSIVDVATAAASPGCGSTTSPS